MEFNSTPVLCVPLHKIRGRNLQKIRICLPVASFGHIFPALVMFEGNPHSMGSFSFLSLYIPTHLFLLLLLPLILKGEICGWKILVKAPRQAGPIEDPESIVRERMIV